MVARLTLDQLVKVRILLPQPVFLAISTHSKPDTVAQEGVSRWLIPCL